jgi:hypothetical protein
MDGVQENTEAPVEEAVVAQVAENEKPAAQAEDGPEEQRTVQKPNGGNLQAALKEERERRKQLQQKVADMEDKQTRFNQRIASAFSDEQTVQKAPVFEENPAEYLRDKVEKTEKSTEELSNFFKQQQTMTVLAGYGQSKINEFKQSTPDYDAAYAFARKDRVEEILELEGCTEAEAQFRANREEVALLASCKEKGKNPAEAIYKYAKRRGYKPAEGEETSEAEQTIDRIQKGQAASKSLSSSAGKPTAGLTMEKILAMDDEEFADFKAKNPRKIRELMGEKLN